MNRPNDQRSKIGAARENKDKKSRRDRGDERDDGPVRFPTNKKRDASPPRRQKPRDSRDNNRYERSRPRDESLRVVYKNLDDCTVSKYTVREGSIHESDNFYEFLKKLLEQVNSTLSMTAPVGSYRLKEIRETISPASEGEKKKLAHKFRTTEYLLHCSSIIIGLPPCVFIGNGFSEKQWNLAKTSAGKDMVDKIYRIGFITPRLYEFVKGCRRYDSDMKAPDFMKAVNAFVCLEKRMGNYPWPFDMLQASDQPLKVLDALQGKFREVLLEVYGTEHPTSTENTANMSPRSREEAEIERKIAMQREEMLRRERVREMVEPLEDGTFGVPASMPLPMGAPPMMPPWANGPGMRPPPMPMHPMGLNPMAPMMGGPMGPMMPGMMPPLGMLPPPMAGGPYMGVPMGGGGGGPPIMKPVDMDIDEPSPHPYSRRPDSPQDRWRRDRSPGLTRREEEMRKSEEKERLRRKEEELERKMREEEERKKRQIEDEVRRRVEEELSKRAPPAPMNNNSGYSTNTVSHPYQSQPVDNGYRGQGDVYGGHANAYNSDAEMDEIHRLIKQTEDRLREVQAEESSLYGSGDHTALRSLVAMGENASVMTSHQKQEFISGLKNILGQSAPTAAVSSTGDRWRSTASRDIPIARASHDEDRYVSTYHTKPREYERRERSRSRSPRRDRSPARSRRHRSSHNDRDHRRDHSSRDAAPQCAYCESYAHLSDICHKFTTPSTRKLELRKSGRCSTCLLKHGGKCDYGQSCEYCGHKTHHRSICEHPDHMRKLNALRDLARGY